MFKTIIRNLLLGCLLYGAYTETGIWTTLFLFLIGVTQEFYHKGDQNGKLYSKKSKPTTIR